MIKADPQAYEELASCRAVTMKIEAQRKKIPPRTSSCLSDASLE